MPTISIDEKGDVSGPPKYTADILSDQQALYVAGTFGHVVGAILSNHQRSVYEKKSEPKTSLSYMPLGSTFLLQCAHGKYCVKDRGRKWRSGLDPPILWISGPSPNIRRPSLSRTPYPFLIQHSSHERRTKIRQLRNATSTCSSK